MRKPGALEHSLALRQEREQGCWPDGFDQLWRAIEGKVGASEAARQLVDVLLLCREHGLQIVELAVRGALAAGAHDGRAVAVLIDRRERPKPQALADLADGCPGADRRVCRRRRESGGARQCDARRLPRGPSRDG